MQKITTNVRPQVARKGGTGGIMNRAFLHRLLLAFSFFMLLAANSKAQNTVAIGTGTSTSNLYGPIYRAASNSPNDFQRTAYYYPKVDLANIPIGATITQLEWNLITTTTITGTGNAPFTIYLKNSNATGNTVQPWATIQTGATQVFTKNYSNTDNFPPVGWVPFVLGTPYVYLGEALFINTDWNISAVSNNPTAGGLVWQATTGFPSVVTRFEPGTTVAPTNLTYTRTERPNIKITYTDPAVFAPASFTATPTSSSQIDLAWGKNASNEPVIIVANSTNTFGTPVDGVAYSASNAIPGGGTVIYRGPASGFNHTSLTAATGYYYAAYSYTSANAYSYPIKATATTYCQTFMGTYTIGAGGNFATFNAATAALACGNVAGPVIFNVLSGTYNEAVTLNEVTGVSATNTITFQSSTGVNTDVVLTQAASNDVLTLDGGDYFIIKNISITSANGNAAHPIRLENAANYNTIQGCRLEKNTTTSANINYSIIRHSETAAAEHSEYNSFIGNTLIGGAYGINYNFGVGLGTGITIHGNTFQNQYANAIVLTYQNAPTVISGNTITTNSAYATGFVGISIANSQGAFAITGNTIYGTGNIKGGIDVASAGTSGTYALVANNMITAGSTTTTQGIFLNTNANYINLYYNSILVTAGNTTTSQGALYSSTSGTAFLNIRNNIFVNTGGGVANYAVNFANTLTNTTINFNNYFVSGANLGRRGSSVATCLSGCGSASWATLTSQDGNSININPQFVSNTDLHVGASGLAVGTPIAGLTTDIDGQTRHASTPYIGADEIAPPVTVWTGAVSTSWFDDDNWTAGVPTATLDAVIANVSATSNRYPLLTSIAGSYGEAKDLTIDAGASVTLPPGTSIRVSGNLTNNGSAHFGAGTLRFTNAATHTIDGNLNVGIVTIEANTTLNGTANIGEALNLVTGVLNTTTGTLTLKSNATTTAYINDFGVNTGSIMGNVTVERYVANTINGFHYIGTPVGGTNITDWNNEFSTAGPNNAFVIPQSTCDPAALAAGSPYGGLFDYVEGNVTDCYLSGWRVRSVGSLGNTEGYAGIIADGTTINVTGTANTGNINSPTLSKTTANLTSTQGMHLVSNPYPSPIDWFEVKTINPDIDGTAYLWLSNGGFQGTYQPVNAIAPGSSLIGSSQGFFVEALNNGAVLNYTNDVRVAANTSFFRSGPAAYESRLVLNVAGNGYNDRTVVAFASNFTDAYDNDFDSKKMLSKNGVVTVYTTTNPAYPRQATNALPNDRSVKVVPVGFLPGTNGNFTFTADDLATFAVSSLVYLEDKQLGTFTNLLQQNTYTFSSLTTDAADRFVLHFVPNVVVTKQNADCDSLGSVSVDLGLFDLGSTPIVWNSLTLTDANNTTVWNTTQASGLQTQGGIAANNYTLTLAIDGYTVTLPVIVGGLPTITASALVSDTVVLEGEAINFTNNSSGATAYTWSFGDSNTSTDASPTHTYATAGTYTVTLTASNNDCSANFTQIIVVDKEQGTNVVEATLGSITIFANSRTIVVRLKDVQDKVDLDLLDVMGRKLIDTQTLQPSQFDYRLNLSPIASGYYFVRVHGGGITKVEKVFLGE